MSAKLGIGLAAVARPAYITSGRAHDLGSERSVESLRDRTWEVLDAAVACGVDYIDVARSYGRAEEFLAGWLDAHPGVRVEVGSKWGYRYVGDWRTDATVHEVKDHSITAFTEQLALTRATLGNRFGVYHVHSATLDTGVLADTSLHNQLAALRDEGVRVGISTSGPRQTEAIRRALEIQVNGRPLFTSIQSTWNVLEPSAGPALAEAAATGARVIVKEPVANGLLAPGGQDGSPVATKAAALADEAGVGIDKLAIAVALARPWAWRVLSGGVDGAQVRSNAAAADVDLRGIDTALLEELSDLARPPEEYWATRSARAWS